MQIIAIVYIVLIVLSLMAEPFLFGERRQPYNAKQWAFAVLLNAPLVYLLFTVATS